MIEDYKKINGIDITNIMKFVGINKENIVRMFKAGAGVPGPAPAGIFGIEDDVALQLFNGAQYANGELVLSRSSSQYGTLSDNNAYDRLTGETMTISGKFYMNSQPAKSNQTIISKMTGANAWDGYVLAVVDSGGDKFRYYLAINGSNSNNSTNISTTINVSQWYSYSIVIRSNKNISLWLDASNIDNRIVNEIPGNTSVPLILGAIYTNPGHTNHFDGLIKDIKIHKRELTSQEISNLHNGIDVV